MFVVVPKEETAEVVVVLVVVAVVVSAKHTSHAFERHTRTCAQMRGMYTVAPVCETTHTSSNAVSNGGSGAQATLSKGPMTLQWKRDGDTTTKYVSYKMRRRP
jgi:hypothetical protein